MLVLTVFSSLVAFYDTIFDDRMRIIFPVLPFTLSAPALGLLLVFRVNSASARFNEARVLWGDIVNRSRDIARQSQLWAQDREHAAEFCRWIPAFMAALMCRLRYPDEHSLEEELRRAGGPEVWDEGYLGHGLSSAEIADVMARPQAITAPLYIMHRMAAHVKRLNLTTPERLSMEAHVTGLLADLGACERILSTPIPLGYTRHTTRFLFLWLFLLPFALEKEMALGAILAEVMLAFAMLGIEDVGISMEEPFGMLPLETICGNIARECQVLRTMPVPLGEFSLPERPKGRVGNAELLRDLSGS